MNVITQNLIETKEGVIVPAPHGELISSGQQDLIVKHTAIKEVNKLYYLLSDNLCYGILRLKTPEKLNVENFETLHDRHHISVENKNKWWPRKEVLFSYEFDVISKFPQPRPVKVMNETLDFVKEFEFLNYEDELLESLSDYNSKDATTDKLQQDFKICLSWHATKKAGGHIKHSFEDIKNLAEKIYFEMIQRDKCVDFEPNTMHPLSKELYDSIEIRKLSDNSCKSPEKIETKINFSEFMKVINEFMKKVKKVSVEFADVEETLSMDKRYALEKKLSEDHVLLVKNNDEITILSKNGEDITESHADIVSEAYNLSSKNLIIQGELSDNILYATDLMYLDKTMTNASWGDRKQLLHTLKLSKNIQVLSSIVVDGAIEARKAITLLKNIPGSIGVTMRSYGSNYSVDEEFYLADKPEERNITFFDSWSGDMAYFLGFISTDGSMEEDRNRIEVKISSLDKSILEKLGKALGKESVSKVGDNASRFRFSSAHMIARLKKLGFDKDKTKRTCHNSVPDAHKWMFARGVFDADGSVVTDRIQIDSGNKNLLKWMQSLFGEAAKLYDYDTYAKVVVLGDDAKKVLSKLYAGNPNVGLKRKGGKSIENTEKISYEEETEIIRKNKCKPEANNRHKFKAAQWTHKNGHPRCIICGDEETTTGYCNDTAENYEKLATTTTSPGISSVQGGYIDKKKKPNQRDK